MSFPLHDSVWVNLLLDSKNGKVPNLTPHALYTALRRLVGDSHMGYRLHEEMIKHYQEVRTSPAPRFSLFLCASYYFAV
jgi:glutamine synthetase